MAKILPPADDQGTPPAWAYPSALRAAAAGLVLVSGASLPLLLSRAFLATGPPMTVAEVLRAFLAVSALPALAAWLLRRVLVAEVDVCGAVLEVRVGGQQLALPLAAIAGVEPWRVPLPQPGFALRLHSGGHFDLGLAADDPSRIVARLAAGGVAQAATALDHPTLVYARVKDAAGPFSMRRLVAKFVLFGALVAGVVFNAHQNVAYGGPWGQFQLEGAIPFAKAFAGYWSAVTVGLVFYATVWRWFAEIVAWLAARWGSVVATRVRRSVELVCRLAYYAGVPMLLALRFAQ